MQEAPFGLKRHAQESGLGPDGAGLTYLPNTRMTRPIDSRQLLAFVCAARQLSFTRAAEELHLTQSAISHAMRALEEDLGCQLFTRGRRKVELTVAGERFFHEAESILGEMERARASVHRLEETEVQAVAQ